MAAWSACGTCSCREPSRRWGRVCRERTCAAISAARAAEITYTLKRQTVWEWKFVGEGPGNPVFYVAFDETYKLVASGIPDPALRSGHQAGPDAAGATAPCSPLP